MCVRLGMHDLERECVVGAKQASKWWTVSALRMISVKGKAMTWQPKYAGGSGMKLFKEV